MDSGAGAAAGVGFGSASRARALSRSPAQKLLSLWALRQLSYFFRTSTIGGLNRVDTPAGSGDELDLLLRDVAVLRAQLLQHRLLLLLVDGRCGGFGGGRRDVAHQVLAARFGQLRLPGHGDLPPVFTAQDQLVDVFVRPHLDVEAALEDLVGQQVAAGQGQGARDEQELGFMPCLRAF